MTVSVAAFGAVGNGTTDDAAAIQAALNSIATSGGTVVLEDNKQYLVQGSDLVIPRGVTLRGTTPATGLRGTNAGNSLNTFAGLRLHPSRRIKLKAAAGLFDITVINPTLTYPQPNDLSYSGTAVEFQEDDAVVENALIVGYEQAIVSPIYNATTGTGPARGRLRRVNIDCINGTYVAGAFDIWYFNEVHCWPFGTISSVTNGDTRRRGIAYHFENVADWCKLTDCFSYGYMRGIRINNCNSMTILNCGFDNVPYDSPRDAIGILLEGYCGETRIIGAQVAASRRAITVNLQAGTTLISDTVTWANYGVGLETNGATVITLVNSIIRDTPVRIATPTPANIIQSVVL